MNAQDPSHLVQQQLQNHVHLISNHGYPRMPALGIEQALRYLVEAPGIVKQGAAMSWHYVQAPQDGSIWLEWISSRNGEYRFASDGYVWADPEQTYRQDYGGYTIELLTHTIGYRLSQEPLASHARTRFHLIAKNPAVNAPPPDPSLWIVHYHQADQHRMMPSNQLPLSAQMKQIMSERRWLEMQGSLERKVFMLHDREHWPQITIPVGPHMQQAMQQHPGLFANNPMMQQQQQIGGGIPRYPQQQQHQQPFAPSQGPPAKRPRHSGPAMPGSSDGIAADAIDGDEVDFMDYFDALTPRDISLTRYKQHHEWMEEVFSSPYPTSQIVPPDLGLGLMGELKGLTDGLLDPPSVGDVKDINPSTLPLKAREAQAFTNLKQEQVDEFNRRVEKHLADGRAEIERMKKEHAEKMSEWKRTKTAMQAEKRLRYATWEGHESAVPVHRLEVLEMNGHAEDGGARENVEDVVNEVEGLLGLKVQVYSDATMVQKGGLERQEEVVSEDVVLEAQDDAFNGFEAQQSTMNAGHDAMQQDFQPQQTSIQQPPPAQSQFPDYPTEAPPSALQPVKAPTPPAQDSTFDDLVGQEDLNDMSDMDMGDDSLMDIDFVDHDEDELGEDPTITPTQAIEPPVAPAAVPPAELDPMENSAIDEASEPIPEIESTTAFGGVEQLTAAEEAAAPPPAAEVLQQAAEEEAVVVEVNSIALEDDSTALEAASETEPPEPPAVDSPPAVVIPADDGSPLQPKDTIPAGNDDLSSLIDTATGVETISAPVAEDLSAEGLFDDGTFDDLADMDGGDDGDLVDFEDHVSMEMPVAVPSGTSVGEPADEMNAGVLEESGMGESAFGDAFHGMDSETPVAPAKGDGGEAADSLQ